MLSPLAVSRTEDDADNVASEQTFQVPMARKRVPADWRGAIGRADDGQILVDKRRHSEFELGHRSKPDAFLKRWL